MFVFCVGMERCGTHSLANILNHACMLSHHVVHEEKPLLCKEAFLYMQGQDYKSTTDYINKKSYLKELGEKYSFVCESNHRLGFFISDYYNEFDASFIWLVRNPINTLISKIACWGHWKCIIDRYPDYFKEEIKNNESINKCEFNEYRIRPSNMLAPLHQIYLEEWLITYKETRKQLSLIPKHKRLIIRTENITFDVKKIFSFINKDYFQITNEVKGWIKLKADSIYPQNSDFDSENFKTQNRNMNDKSIIYAKSLITPNIQEISQKIIEEISLLLDDNLDLNEIDLSVISEQKTLYKP